MAKLAIEVHSMGDLVSDSVAAYLKQGNPSALIGRLVDGLDAYTKDETNNADDRAFVAPLRARLVDLRARWVQYENETYHC